VSKIFKKTTQKFDEFLP
jgi:hypothetical protein